MSTLVPLGSPSSLIGPLKSLSAACPSDVIAAYIAVAPAVIPIIERTARRVGFLFIAIFRCRPTPSGSARGNERVNEAARFLVADSSGA
ncbi:hypothetical protein [Paracoccus sanguinis]|uniref:hypothetical protein n=1 Tax=Paracoccus sanguinis TaxID=1545044 RepID=UPI0018CF24BF|nr:hypothetical protein [Paracoccus sanguinis]